MSSFERAGRAVYIGVELHAISYDAGNTRKIHAAKLEADLVPDVGTQKLDTVLDAWRRLSQCDAPHEQWLAFTIEVAL
jgi:hypothetical protein